MRNNEVKKGKVETKNVLSEYNLGSGINLNTGNLGNKDVKSVAAASTPTETIDVRDLDWTYSKNKNANKDEIPYIELKEFKMAGNSYLSSLMTSALLFPDVVESQVGRDGSSI